MSDILQFSSLSFQSHAIDKHDLIDKTAWLQMIHLHPKMGRIIY